MPGRLLPGAMCVQRFDDSLNSAIHITYRISLRSSSMREPRDPLLKVVLDSTDYKESRRGFSQKGLKNVWILEKLWQAEGGLLLFPPRRFDPSSPPNKILKGWAGSKTTPAKANGQ